MIRLVAVSDTRTTRVGPTQTGVPIFFCLSVDTPWIIVQHLYDTHTTHVRQLRQVSQLETSHTSTRLNMCGSNVASLPWIWVFLLVWHVAFSN